MASKTVKLYSILVSDDREVFGIVVKAVKAVYWSVQPCTPVNGMMEMKMYVKGGIEDENEHG